MAANNRVEIETRIRRLERLALLSFTESHGLRAEMASAAVGPVRDLRARCALDAAAIMREHAEPALERRPA